MGSCNCVNDTCNKNTFLFTEEINPITNKLENPDKLNSFNSKYDNSFLNDPQYQNIGNEFFNLLNDIRINPEKYAGDSRDYSLLEIFMKLKPCKKITLSEKNNVNIKNYLIDSHLKGKSIVEQEKEIKDLIDEGNINEICLFQTIIMNSDIKENVWLFLQENEDDFEKIFTNEYNYLIVICFPLEYKTKILTSLIFY